jgi:hypothetical protein
MSETSNCRDYQNAVNKMREFFHYKGIEEVLENDHKEQLNEDDGTRTFY